MTTYRAVMYANPDRAIVVLGPGEYEDVKENARAIARLLGVDVVVERVEEL